MIYLVTKKYNLMSLDIMCISVEQSLRALMPVKAIQLDTETDGCDPHVNRLLTMQLGIEGSQYVIDATTIDIKAYRYLLENHRLIGQNLKFDLKFLYNYGIVPRKVYDTMIAEQVLNLGYKNVGFSLQAIADKRLGIYLDKSIRGQIRWRGIDESVIRYAAKDVEHLVQIMESQWAEAKVKGLKRAIVFENAFVPVVAYMEWCGIHIDETLWKLKIEEDQETLDDATDNLNWWCLRNPKLKDFIHQDTQGDLWGGYNMSPKCDIDWRHPDEVAKIASALGFKVKDTVNDASLQRQRGIADEFVQLYMAYKSAWRNVAVYNANYLNAVNPNTGRIHTEYRQLGADSGRMSCGSSNNNDDLARLKKMPIQGDRVSGKACVYPNIQGTPKDKKTRGCFTAQKGNLFVSCDYKTMEIKIAAKICHEDKLATCDDVYQMVADAIKTDRDTAKKVTLAILYGGNAGTVEDILHCDEKQARVITKKFLDTFKGVEEYRNHEIRKTRDFGYILINPWTGHKTFWQNWAIWREESARMTSWFWQDYKAHHQGSDDETAQAVREHFKIQGLWDRKTLNTPIQGTGAIILKASQIEMFRLVVKHGLFGKALLVNLSHDEADWEIPEGRDSMMELLKFCMKEAALMMGVKIDVKQNINKFWE